MGKMYFSPSNCGFYPEEFRKDYEASATGWPEDALEIPYELYESLLAEQQENKVIVAGDNGYPVLQHIEGPTSSQLKEIADENKQVLMMEAAEMIAPLQDAVDLDIATEDETSQWLAWKKYRVLLNRVDTSKAPEIDWPEKPTEHTAQ
ncbi:tail fiber assembly protein [Citrobacter koseri]|uniref:tail fiber assembly protein n=1 Tax=Citrobacter koseri TaxID=545 RepID=UPI0024B63D86|nr:tail fiber assembly protein [Citrobacter koseri]MDI9801768.1 tail fiber assembly protein [Citrobacter koseri]